MAQRNVTAFVAGAITAVVVGTGTAYAATGGTFVVGHANSAYRMTTLTNYRGSSLYLRSKYGYPSFRVNRTTKIPYLNSDLLDGQSSNTFALASPTIGTVVAYGQALETDAASPGPDLVVAVATCPAGSQLVGGGGVGPRDSNLFVNAPGSDNDYNVVSDTRDFSADNVHQVEAHARCYNPRANVASTEGITPRKVFRTPAGRRLVAQARQLAR